MSQAYAAVYYTKGDAEWPFDIGDDPSFRAARGNANTVTWGVCRRDLRNALRPGDVVLFFATLPRNIGARTQIPYWFVGYATVAEKVKQTNVFLERRLANFKLYQNLLINKVNRTTFEHHESPGQRHDDWLYRLTCGRMTKAPFVRAGEAERFREGPTELSSPVPAVDVAPNYVIFSTERRSTLILRSPPRVAALSRLDASEAWDCKKLEDLLFACSSGRTSLRTTNRYNGAHRHVRLDRCDGADLRARIHALALEEGWMAARAGWQRALPSTPKQQEPRAARSRGRGPCRSSRHTPD